METEAFSKYEYQNMICENDLSGLEMRILIRLSNSYGNDGLICPSNAKLAIWLGKISQEAYDKAGKTDDEKLEIKRVVDVIKYTMRKLKTKFFIETELTNNNKRKIFLLNPKNKVRYQGVINYTPLTSGGVSNHSPRGEQILTPGGGELTPL